MKPLEKPSWIADFPHFQGLDPLQMERVIKNCKRLRLAVNATAFETGEPCEHYLLVRQGSIRVSLIDTEGNEIVLYRLTGGQSCVLTTATLLARARYEAVAIAERPVEAILIPGATFDSLIEECTSFRNAVFADHGTRLLELMSAIGRLAFESTDFRLLRMLADLSNDAGIVQATHQAIAVEVGTAREVVSRRLKHYEGMGWVKLQRGRLSLLKGFPLVPKRAP